MQRNTHLCVTKPDLIRPANIWQVRWITEDDYDAFNEPFHKNQDHGWTMDEFRELQSEGYSYCGVFLGGRICSIAGLWKRAHDVWEVIAVGTREEYMRRGMASSVVYFIADYILNYHEAASYTSRKDNTASIHTAQSVGFRYCTNICHDDKWCASDPRPCVCESICPLIV